jgi:hypothetical protein
MEAAMIGGFAGKINARPLAHDPEKWEPVFG